jgi:hypothetical protein
MSSEEIKKDILCMCSRCHKVLSQDTFMRLNYKGTGQKRQFKICNVCNLNKIKTNIDLLTKTIDAKFNFMKNYNNDDL